MTPTTLALILAAAGGASFLLSLMLTAGAVRVARRIGFVDRPGGHKSHREPTPYGGGTAIVLAAGLPMAVLMLAALLAPQSWIAERFGGGVRAYVGGLHDRAAEGLAILCGALAIHVMGLFDDVRPLGARAKLTVLFTVGLLVSWLGGVRMAEFAGAPVSIAVTTLWIVVICNAFNFLDNMDGLSAGVTAIALAFFVACGMLAGQLFVPALGIVFCGAVSGFLVFNFPPARIFMGDAGSLICGYMLAIVSVMTTYYPSGGATPPYALAMPLVILAVPLYDFLSVLTIRAREGRALMRGDQRHFSHRLVEHGLSRRFAVITIYIATATTGLAATLLPGADLRRTVTIGVIVLLVLAIVAILESKPRSE